jgi:hypothetical protein
MGLPQLVHVTNERDAPSDITVSLFFCDGSLMQDSLISAMLCFQASFTI